MGRGVSPRNRSGLDQPRIRIYGPSADLAIFCPPAARVALHSIVLTSSRVTDMFKSLGCAVDLPSPAEREKMGIKLADANKFRKATLKAPLRFPKTKRRGPAKR